MKFSVTERKCQHDTRANNADIEAGKVWLDNSLRKRRQMLRLQSPWEGPNKEMDCMSDMKNWIQRSRKPAPNIMQVSHVW